MTPILLYDYNYLCSHLFSNLVGVELIMTISQMIFSWWEICAVTLLDLFTVCLHQ